MSTQNTIDRTQKQLDTAQLLLDKKRVICTWSTSSGKSNVAIFAIQRLVQENPFCRILLLVAERSHKDNWHKEFIKFLGEAETNTIYNCLTVECYASLHKYVNTKWTACILDECHHLFSDIRYNIARTLQVEYVLALSATLKREHIAELEALYGKFEVSRISLQKSIDNGFVAQPKIYLIPLTLQDSLYTQTIEINWGLKAKRKTIRCDWKDRFTYLSNRKLYPNVNLIVKCTEQQKYDYLEEQFEYSKKRYFSSPANLFLKNQWLQIGSQRKRYLGELKTDYANTLIHSLRKDKKRVLCFCTSIEQANILGKDKAIHSKVDNPLSLVEKFNTKQINSLYAVSMLTEGVSLTQVDAEIIVQLDGNEKQWLQKLGRGLRSSEPIIYVFYYRNTRDEGFLSKALETINKEYVSNYTLNK